MARQAKWSGECLGIPELPIIIDVGSLRFCEAIRGGGVGFTERGSSCLVDRRCRSGHTGTTAEQIHGISRDVWIAMDGLRALSPNPLNLLQGKTVYTDGWGVDRPWLVRCSMKWGCIQLFKLNPSIPFSPGSKWKSGRQLVNACWHPKWVPIDAGLMLTESYRPPTNIESFPISAFGRVTGLFGSARFRCACGSHLRNLSLAEKVCIERR